MIDGRLFTRDFLLEGIKETAQWRAVDDAELRAWTTTAKAMLDALVARKNANEAQTEADLVYPLLETLGWRDRDVQPNLSVKRRLDVPDALLYPDAAAKALAAPLDPDKRFQHGICIVEAKRWLRVLDRETKGHKDEEGTPSSQMLRYLRRADDRTQGKLRWGILTNGRLWRLYFHAGTGTSENFLEVDLGMALHVAGCEPDIVDRASVPEGLSEDAWRAHVLRLFFLLFGREAFLPHAAGESFHQLALREGRRWEEKVKKSLSEKVFGEVFPTLADALAKADPLRKEPLEPDYLGEVRQGALILLYRLLFVLYAEDRNLLPDETGPYAEFCLTRVRFEVAQRQEAGKHYPKGVVTIWPRLMTIFSAIAEGNDDLGIPPYNGGLFDRNAAPILSRVHLPDTIVAAIILALSHEPDVGDGRGLRYINYRDLSVQQLGSVYERLLEYDLRVSDGGKVEIDADDAARHSSGSYYTPEELVGLVIGRAVGPLLHEKRAAFQSRAETLEHDRRPIRERLIELEAFDPASAFLSLKVCDPAMGSGHFLVSLVDWMADAILESLEEARRGVSWADYASPLADRIAAVREKISYEARAHRWPIVEAQLDDRHVVRRMVLKRVVYGVDKNPMAVELAKVALWLHSFTVGAPLSFLDHHLRDGDSVIGAFVRPTVDALQARGALFSLGQITRVEQVAGLMARIEETTDNDIIEVTSSKQTFGAVKDTIRPVEALFSLLTAEKMIGVFEDAPARVRETSGALLKARAPARKIEKARAQESLFERAVTLQAVLEGTLGDPMAIASGAIALAPEPEALKGFVFDEAGLPLADGQGALSSAEVAGVRRRVLAARLVEEMRHLALAHGFLHWEIAFPNVWNNLASTAPQGGFDAIIGNPPFVRQELLGPQIKRALRGSYKAFDGVADLYVYFHEQGLRLLKPGGRMSYVVTNKWLKAGYAEELRGLFAGSAWLEFVADFGHAKHFFPDADVFPSVLVMRRPVMGEPEPNEASVCVIPRDIVPRKGLIGAVEEATFTLPRAMFTKQAWILEPKPVMDLLDKIRRNGVPLAEYAGCKPFRGVTTGLNEAFFVDNYTREKLVKADPRSTEIIKPYLRGQDIERWNSPDSGLYMIFARRGIDINAYPAVKRHLEGFRGRLEPKPVDWRPQHQKDEWLGRKEGSYAWYEIQDSVEYWELFAKPKIIYQAIQFYPSYSFDDRGLLLSNKGFFITSDDFSLLAALNAPIGWWVSWRHYLHLKDEALSNDGVRLAEFPIAEGLSASAGVVHQMVVDCISLKSVIVVADAAILDWLRHEFGLDRPGAALSSPHALDPDAFVAAVRKALPRARKLSAADIARLKQEHRDTLEPAARAANDLLALERKLSDLVNAAYGLTSEEVKLMWDTAPPRMPFSI